MADIDNARQGIEVAGDGVESAKISVTTNAGRDLLKLVVSRNGFDLEVFEDNFESLSEDKKSKINFLIETHERSLSDEKYKFKEFIQLFGLIIGNLPDEMKKKIDVSKIREKDFNKLKAAARERKKLLTKNLSESRKTQVMSERQISMLSASPTLNINQLIRQSKNLYPHNKKLAFAEFQKKYIKAMYNDVVNPWMNRHKSLFTVEKDEKGVAIDKLLRVNNITSFSASGTGKMLSMLSGKGGALFGNKKGIWDAFKLKSDKTLDNLLSKEGYAKLIGFMATKNYKQADIEGVIAKEFEKVFEKDGTGDKIFAQIEKTFKPLSVNIDEPLSPDDEKFTEKYEEAKLIKMKLESIPEGWRGDEARVNDYEQYVMDTGNGSMNFDQWIKTKKVSKFDSFKAMILTNFGGILKMIGFWKGGKNFAKLEQYRDYLKDGKGDYINKPKKEDEISEDKKIELNERKSIVFNKLTEQSKKYGGLRIKKKGLLIKNSTFLNDTEIDDLEALEKKIRVQPNAGELLNKGFSLKDFKDLVKNLDQDTLNENSVDLSLAPEGIKIKYDEGLFFGFKSTDVLSGAGFIIGACWALAKLHPAGRFASILGSVVVAGGRLATGYGLGFGAGGILDGLIPTKGGSIISYSDPNLNPKKLKQIITEFKSRAKILEAELKKIDKNKLVTIIKDLEGHKDKFSNNITSFPPELFVDGKLEPSFKELLELSKWGNPPHKMSQDDLNNFARGLQNGTFDRADSLGKFSQKNVFGGTFDTSSGRIEINGSANLLDGEWNDIEKNNVEGFFDWLKTKK